MAMVLMQEQYNINLTSNGKPGICVSKLIKLVLNQLKFMFNYNSTSKQQLQH